MKRESQNICRFFLLIVLISVLLSVQALGVEVELSSTGESGLYTYEVVDESFVRLTGLTIEDKDREFVYSVKIPESMDGYPVEELGAYLFSDCVNLESVTIPDSIRIFGCGTFQNCKNLTSVRIPAQTTTQEYTGNRAYPGPFNGCILLRDVTFAEGRTSIPDGMFLNCDGLQSIVIPDTVTYIGWLAFGGCGNLKEVTLSSQLETLRNNAFESCTALTSVTLPDSLMTLGCGAFMNCTSLASVYIPAQMTTQDHTGNRAYPGPFNGCSALKTVTFGEGRTEIPAGLFLDCTGLESITLPEGVKITHWLAFARCYNLKEVKFNQDLEIIGGESFKDCTALAELNLSEALNRIDNNAFQGCTALTDVTLPDSMQVIGRGAFLYCTGLSRVYIPAGMKTDGYCGENSFPGPFSGCAALNDVVFAPGRKEIPQGMFYGCSGLKTFTVPDDVQSIKYRAFRDCANLETVIFHDQVTEIATDAFWNCKALAELNLPDAVYLGLGAFRGCTGLKSVHIPVGLTTSRYAGWYDPGPFYGCSALTEVAFDKGCTTIPDGLFADCDGLEKIVIPEGITNVAQRAFKNCASLKRVCFRGDGPEVVALDKDGRSFPSYATLYHMQHRSGWTDSDAYDGQDHTWNGYKLGSWNGMILDVDTLVVPEGKYCFHVVDSKGDPIPDVTVSWSAVGILDPMTAVTDAEGNAFVPQFTVGEPLVTVEKEGYLTWSNEDTNWEKNEYRYDIVVLYTEEEGAYRLKEVRYSSDYGPITYDVLTWTKKISLGAGALQPGGGEFRLSCKAYNKDRVERYELWQDLTMVAQSEDGAFNDLSTEQFREGGDCFVRVVAKDGAIMDSHINLEFVKLEINEKSEFNLSGDKLEFKVDDDFPFLGGMNVEFDLPINCPVHVVLSDDGAVQFGFNVNLTDEENGAKNLEDVKKFISDARTLKDGLKSKDKAKLRNLLETKNDLAFLKNGELDFVGYAELDPGSTTAKGCIYIEGKIDLFNYDYNTIVPVATILVPVTVQVGLEGSVVVARSITYDWADATLLGELDVAPAAKLEVFGGVGTSGIAGAGAYGSAELKALYRMVGRPRGWQEVTLTGELGVKAYLGPLSAEKPFAYNTWYLYTANSVQKASSVDMPVMLCAASDFRLQDLSYLEEESSWLGAAAEISLLEEQASTTLTSLLEDTYRNAQPVMVSDGEKLYAAFLRADAETGSVYTVATSFDGEIWADPVQTDLDAVMHSGPDLCVDADGTVWMAYAETAADYDPLSLVSYAENQRIVVGQVDADSLAFTELRTYETEGYGRGQKLAVVNGIPTLVWVDSEITDDNSVLFPQGGTVYAAQWNGERWSDAVVLAELDKPILSLAAGVAAGELAVACIMDGDGNAATQTDRILCEVTETGVQTLGEGSIGTVIFSQLPGADAPCFLWNEPSMLRSSDGTAVAVNGITDAFSVVNDRIYYSMAADGAADLMFIRYADGQWSAPIQATDGERYLENLSVASANGQDYVLGMYTDVTIGEDTVTDKKNLVWSAVMPVHDLKLDDVWYEDAGLAPGEPVALTLDVRNAGEAAVSAVDVSIDGRLVETLACDLQPGQQTELSVEITCPTALTRYQVSVEEAGAGDALPVDNTAETAVGYAEVAVEVVQQTLGENRKLLAYVTNGGVDTATGTVTFLDGTGMLVGECAFRDLKAGETTVVALALTDAFLGTGDLDLTVNVQTEQEDLYAHNNTATTHIGSIPLTTKIFGATRSGAAVTAEIACDTETGSTAVLAAYNDRGKLLEVYLHPLQSGVNTIEQMLSHGDAAQVRIFVLDEHDRPLCSHKTAD